MCKKRRILYIVEAMGGGVFTYLVDLSNQLSRNDEIFIAYAVRPQTPSNFKEYFRKDIHLIEVEGFIRSVNPAKDVKAFLNIRKIAKEVKPDIIHLHSSKAGFLGRWAFNGNRIPLFYTPHGYSFLMLNQSALKRSIYKALENICGKRPCITISCSEGEHQESIKINSGAVYVNNGVNITELNRLMNSLKKPAPHPFTVFTLGRICDQKNPKLFNQIALAMPDVNFLWIGDGELRNLLNAPNIQITGWVKRAEALEYSLQADVFILTSLWEGLPISLLEAMCMKKVCVVSDVIGNHDVIHHQVNGFVCQETEDFVSAIQQCRNPEIVETLTNYAYEEILQEYNTDVMAKKYSEIYQKALNQAKRG